MNAYLGRLLGQFSTRQAQAALRGETVTVDLGLTPKTRAQAQARAARASSTTASAAVAPALTAVEQRQRIKAILALDEAKGNTAQAMAIALESDMSVDQAKDVLAAAPVAGPARQTIAERAAQAGNLADVGHSTRSTGTAVAASWDRVHARLNALVEMPGLPGAPQARADAGQTVTSGQPAAGPAGATPATPGGETGFHYPHIGDPADELLSLAERLPAGRPRETFRDLGETRHELHAIVAATADALNEARARRNEAHASVRRMTEVEAGETSAAFTLSEAEPQVIRARAKVTAADAMIARAQDRHDAAVARWNATGALHRIAVAYVRQAGGVTLRPWKGKPVSPKAGETIEAAVARARKSIAKLGADLHELRSAPLPVAEVWPRVAAEIERLAEAGRPDVLRALEGREVSWPEASAFVQQAGLASPAHGRVQMHDGFALSMWLNKGPILKKLKAEIEEAADDANAISTADRRTREGTIRAAILAAEHSDVELVEASGGAIEHRPANEVDPRALLGIEGPAPRED